MDGIEDRMIEEERFLFGTRLNSLEFVSHVAMSVRYRCDWASMEWHLVHVTLVPPAAHQWEVSIGDSCGLASAPSWHHHTTVFTFNNIQQRRFWEILIMIDWDILGQQNRTVRWLVHGPMVSLNRDWFQRKINCFKFCQNRSGCWHAWQHVAHVIPCYNTTILWM